MEKKMLLIITVDVPAVVGAVLVAGMEESEKVLICPETINPGFLGKIIDVEVAK